MRGVAGIVGALLLTLSVLNLGMLWWNPQLGTAPWEFAVVGQTFDQLPLLVIALLLLCYPAITAGRIARLVLIVGLGLLVIASGALTILYGLAATVAWSTLVQQPSAGAGLLLRGIVKTVVLGAAYMLAFAFWMLLLLRRPSGRRTQGT